MKKNIQQLYQEVILQHNDHPFNFYKMEDADHVLEAYNQFCGDQFYLYLNVQNDIITQASFHGYGCAISKASTSLLTQFIEGKDLKTARIACENFHSLVFPDQKPSEILSLPESFLAFEAAQAFPARKKCAILSWDELGGFLGMQHN